MFNYFDSEDDLDEFNEKFYDKAKNGFRTDYEKLNPVSIEIKKQRNLTYANGLS